MKITLQQHGGLAAAIKLPPLVLDTDELDDPTRAQVEALAHSVPAQRSAVRSPHPDELAYTLTLENVNGIHQLTSMETASSATFSELVRLVRRHGKASRA